VNVMIQYITPLLGSVLSMLQKDRQHLAKSAGVSENVVEQVTEAMQRYLSEDERLLKLSDDIMRQARQHDIETFDRQDRFSNRLRSVVRPISTFVALAWYVYARLNDIPLVSEDYAIIGGVLAFWFGFRPFEKRN
jgi:hypothetical protein